LELTLKRLQKKLRPDQSGAVVVVTAVGLVMILGVAAVAVDLGHLYMVKSEMQRAADAGALAGAKALYPYSGTPPGPNWSNGNTVATQIVQTNKADGVNLTSATVQAGYWSLTWTPETAPPNLQSQGIIPTSQDVPAVRVTITKSSDLNPPAVNLIFAPIFGFRDTSLTARAVGMIGVPSSIPSGMGFPVATPKALVDQYWNLDPPVSFRIGSDYHNPVGGQWTSFTVDENNVPYIRGLMANGSPTALSIGDSIWIQPGTKTALYSNAAALIGQIVILPVVTTDFETHAWTPILAFVAFYVEDSVGGSGKYLQGYFVKNYVIPGSTPGGPPTGLFTPPMLVQ
jgi:Flp pilus assembly protein TadG